MKAKLVKDVYSVILECYSSDANLLANYHILAPTTLEKAVNHTVETLKDSKVYKLTEKGEFCGYISTNEVDVKFIHGFFLMPKYRDKKSKAKFIKAMKSLVNPLIIPIYDKNIRANRFLIENKFKFVKNLSDEGGLINVYVLQD